MLDVGLPDRGLDGQVVEAIRRRRASGWWLRAAAAAAIPLALGAIGGSLLFNGHAESRSGGSTTVSLIEESFGPSSLRGIDDVARDLEPSAESGR